MFQKYYEKLPNWMRNKYILAFIVFFVYVAVLSNYNLLRQYKLKSEQSKLEQVNRDLQTKIGDLRKIDEDLKQNPLSIERIAREKYGMKREGETVFFIP